MGLQTRIPEEWIVLPNDQEGASEPNHEIADALNRLRLPGNKVFERESKTLLTSCLEHYSARKVTSLRDDKPYALKLHESCPNRDVCWAGKTIEEQEMDYNRIQLPFVGSGYTESRARLVIIGLNMNECGGLDSLYDLIEGGNGVRESLRAGKKRIDFGAVKNEKGEKYGGTMIFHRAAVHAYLIEKTDWRIEDTGVLTNHRSVMDSGSELADVYDHFTFLEAIKCSPSNPPREGKEKERSRPLSSMFTGCPSLYLSQELKILKPRTILVLGLDTPLPSDMILENIHESDDRCMRVYQASDGGRKMLLVKVVHPHFRKSRSLLGGLNLNIVLDVAKYFQQERATSSGSQSRP